MSIPDSRPSQSSGITDARGDLSIGAVRHASEAGQRAHRSHRRHPNRGFTESSRRCLALGTAETLIPLLLPSLKRYYPYFEADASGHPGLVRCKPHRRIS